MANSVLWGLLLLSALQAARPAAAVSPQALVGTWVGTQSWAIEKPLPGARLRDVKWLKFNYDWSRKRSRY